MERVAYTHLAGYLSGLMHRFMVWDAVSHTAHGVFFCEGDGALGPPGFVHGGIVSCAHDDALALAAWGGGRCPRAMATAEAMASTWLAEILRRTCRNWCAKKSNIFRAEGDSKTSVSKTTNQARSQTFSCTLITHFLCPVSSIQR